MCALLSHVQLLFYNEQKIKLQFSHWNWPLISLVVFISESMAPFCKCFIKYTICMGVYKMTLLSLLKIITATISLRHNLSTTTTKRHQKNSTAITSLFELKRKKNSSTICKSSLNVNKNWSCMLSLVKHILLCRTSFQYDTTCLLV